VHLEFSGELWFWNGPAVVERPGAVALRHRSRRGVRRAAATSPAVTYGWGMVPVTVQTDRTRWTTSLFPKDARYLVPVKAHVRDAEGLEVGALVTVRLEVGA